MGSDASALGAAVRQLVEQGRGTQLEGDAAGVVVSELPSGSRLAIDTEGTYWILTDGSLPPARFTASTNLGNADDDKPNGTEHRFQEALEVPRHTFEDALDAGARGLGLPVEEAVLAFPALTLLRAVLALSSAYTARLALKWLLPSERADLAASIAVVARDEHMTQDVRDLARHFGR